MSVHPTLKYSEWVEYYATELTEYLNLYWVAQRDKVEQAAQQAAAMVEKIARSKRLSLEIIECTGNPPGENCLPKCL